MADRYTKIVLTIIAISLTIIAFKLGSPQPAYAGFGSGLTLGELQSGGDISDIAVVYVMNK